MNRQILALSASLLASTAMAEGDAASGEALFNGQCTSCHLIANAAGEVLAGRSARTGPNLFGVGGRAVGSVDGFAYSASIAAAGEMGLGWDEAAFVAFVQDPTDWLRGVLNDPRARAKMSFRVRTPEQAADIYAYLAGFSE